MKNKKNNLIVFFFITISSIFVSIPLFKFNAQYDDGIQHIVRLIENAREIKQGTIFPVIMQNLCNGFGYSWNLFYSPLTAYIPLIFRLFGFSYENSLKLFMFFLSIASGYAMYFFTKKILKKRNISEERKVFISVLSASFYILAPYRLNDMYIRVAVAELASFVFLPIIFNGLYSIINLKEKKYILAFGAIGLILSHTLITLYTVMFCIIYLIVNIKFLKDKKTFTTLTLNILLALLITSFFTVPLLESKLSSDYEVFNEAHMINDNLIIDGKASLEELLYIKKGRMAYFLDLPVIAGILLTFLMIKNKKIEDKGNYYFFLVSGIVSVILTLKFIPFEKFPTIFKMMQFSFRLLEFSSFFLSVIASLNFGLCFKKFTLANAIIIALVMADLLIPAVGRVDFSKEYISEDRLLEGIPVTASTGRVHAGCASFEYLPSKAFENRNYIATRKDEPIILDGNIEISNFEKDRLSTNFVAKGNGIIELPYIYYIGYSAYIDGEKINITESQNGFCQININSEKFSNIKVSYTGTKAMQISMFISIFTLIIFIFYKIKYKKVSKYLKIAKDF